MIVLVGMFLGLVLMCSNYWPLGLVLIILALAVVFIAPDP